MRKCGVCTSSHVSVCALAEGAQVARKETKRAILLNIAALLRHTLPSWARQRTIATPHLTCCIAITLNDLRSKREMPNYRNYSPIAAPNQKMNTPTEQVGAYQRSVFRRKQPMRPRTIPASDNRPPQL